ncbi:hypothetical protein [Pacificoceanicola onchidii]|uniref:hypothetical protein n=1 Tax=Pacificoceanicola onchidii TaxID=2562685 RepID=UPI0010A4DD05|nr:hypothetical protein [Pacificoceanicola onchidii]
MSIVEKVEVALNNDERTRDVNFEEQLKAYEEFRKRMEAAGVAPNKQDFSIPLIERIGTFSFSS